MRSLLLALLTLFLPVAYGMLSPHQLDQPIFENGVSSLLNGKLIDLLDTDIARVRSLLSRNLSITPSNSHTTKATFEAIHAEKFRAGDWGISTSNLDNGISLNNAIDAIANSGGGILELPPGVLTTSSVTLRNNVYLRGQGIKNTVLKLKDGANSDLILTSMAHELFGSNSLSGVNNFGLTDLTLDGNRAHNTGGNCLAIYGHSFTIQNLLIKGCPLSGIRSEYGPWGSNVMSGHLSNVSIDTTGSHGWDFSGPNDLTAEGVLIVDSSQNMDNSAYGMYIHGAGNGRFIALHVWHRGTTMNRPAHALYVESGGSNFSVSHFEGSIGSVLYLSGILNSFDSSNVFYSSFGDRTSTIELVGRNNVLKGIVLGSSYVPGHPLRKGVIIAGAGNEVNLSLTGTDLGTVDFTGSNGLNVVRIIGSQTSGPGYVSAPNMSDEVDLDVYGASSMQHLHVKPFAMSFIGSATFRNTLKLASYPFSSLPTCNSNAAGSIVYVTDSSVTFGRITGGGGSNKVIGLCDGTYWSAH